MGPGIIIPVVVIVIIVPVALVWARRVLQGSVGAADAAVAAPGGRLTSNALRDLPMPPWRVVHEIASDRLGGVEHVLIGPAGVFAVRTSMDPLPAAPQGDPDAQAMARAAIERGPLDDALQRCAMASDRTITVHWGHAAPGGPAAVDVLPGVTAVDGRSLSAWAASLPAELTDAQVDLAWQTVTTAIGRPDPLT